MVAGTQGVAGAWAAVNADPGLRAIRPKSPKGSQPQGEPSSRASCN